MIILFSERLQQLRKDYNLRQIDLAKAINTTQRRISHLESGKIEPDLTTLVSIARHFNVSLDYLVGISDY